MDKQSKIMVVDDFEAMREILRKQLLELGYSNVAEADDGLTALPMLQSGDFDFLVTDLNMPGMSGIDLVRNLREDPALCAIPVLMVTSEARRDQIELAAEVGVNAYIIKPFTIETLKHKLESVSASLGAA